MIDNGFFEESMNFYFYIKIDIFKLYIIFNLYFLIINLMVKTSS
jgi:hypothetical protein